MAIAFIKNGFIDVIEKEERDQFINTGINPKRFFDISYESADLISSSSDLPELYNVEPILLLEKVGMIFYKDEPVQVIDYLTDENLVAICAFPDHQSTLLIPTEELRF